MDNNEFNMNNQNNYGTPSPSRNNPRRKGIVVSKNITIVIVMAAILFLGATAYTIYSINKDKNKVSVEATVVRDTRINSSNDDDEDVTQIEYTVSGKTYKRSCGQHFINNNQNRKYKKGDIVTVYYKKGNPSVLVGTMNYIIFALPIGFFVILIILIYAKIASSKNQVKND